MSLQADQIRNELGVKPPLVLLDKVLKKNTQEIVAVKAVSSNEAYFRGHFPNNPVLPGVLSIESMVEAARLLAKVKTLKSVKKARFHQMIKPGDSLVIKVKRLTNNTFEGKVLLNDEIASSAEFEFASKENGLN